MNLREQYAAARKAAQDIHDKAVAEGRDKTAEEQTEFDAKLAEAKSLKDKLDRIGADEAAMAGLAELQPAPVAVVGQLMSTGPQSLGERFVASAEYQAVVTRPEPASISGPPISTAVPVGSFRNAITLSESLTPPEYVIAPGERGIVDVFDVITVIENAPDAVKIFRKTLDLNAAAVAPGNPKPESTVTYTPETINLETIAHHTPIHLQTLWHNSLLRAEIDGDMVNGVMTAAQAEVVAELLASVSLMQQQAFDSDLATTLRKAVTKAMRGMMTLGTNGEIVTFLAPEDHEQLDLELLEAMVALAGQELSQTARIWRTRIVPLYGLTPGVAFVGDAKQIRFYIGEGIAVRTGWINDQFTKNMLTILAEMEGKAAVIGGAALVATDLDADSAPAFS